MPAPRFFLYLALCSVLVVFGCAAPEKGCVDRYEDSTWAVIGREGAVANLEHYLYSDRVRKSALEILGSPEHVSSAGTGDRLTWIEGGRRSGRTYRCERLVEETFHVTYAVIDVIFHRGAMRSCDVRLLNFIGPDKDPDPASDRPLKVEQKSCADFVSTNQE